MTANLLRCPELVSVFYSILKILRFVWSQFFLWIIIIIIFILGSFPQQHKLKVFPWSPNDGKSSQVSRTHHSILSNLNNTEVCMFSIFPLDYYYYYYYYRRRKWTRRHEFKSWTRLIAFHISLIPLGKVWIQLFSLQLWVNSRTD